MELCLYLEINIIGLLIIGIMYMNIRQKRDIKRKDIFLFTNLLFFTGAMLILDSMMWGMDGTDNALLKGILYVATSIYFILQPFICMLWSFYVDYSINKDYERIKKMFPLAGIPVIVNCILVIINIFGEVYFYFDLDGVYHRGDYFILVTLFTFIYPICTLSYVIVNRAKIYKRFYGAFLVYTIPPFVGAIIQVLIYGMSLIWIAMTISVLIMFIGYQNELMYMDHLTGVFNRRQLDFYISEQIKKKNKKLAGVMIDLNSFKSINDIYGHGVGDEALINVSNILKNTFGINSFLSRYGGDEFIVLIEADNDEELKIKIDELNERVDVFNNSGLFEYKISFGIGYDMYKNCNGMDGYEFLMHLDRLMYENKKITKKLNG